MRAALTGLIGAGKSETLAIARERGVTCLSADEINASLLRDEKYIASIAAAFPQCVRGGEVDKAALADVVFMDEAQLARLNAIAHPAILERILCCEADPLLAELPVFVGTGAERAFDKIIYVRAPLEARIERLMRRGMREADIFRRMQAQTAQEALEKIADVVIDNDGDIARLRAAANAAFDEIFAGGR